MAVSFETKPKFKYFLFNSEYFRKQLIYMIFLSTIKIMAIECMQLQKVYLS